MVIANFDGGCGPKNPGGHGTYGAIVRDDSGAVLLSECGYIGFGPQISNNVAEYAGVIAVLKYLLTNGIKTATVYGDSDLVVKQLSGRWKAKKGLYMPWYREAIALAVQLPGVRFQWIPP